MMSRSYTNLLDLASGNFPAMGSGSGREFKERRRMPRVMSVPGIVSEVDDDQAVSVSSDNPSTISSDRIIIVANQLPLKAKKREDNKGWSFSWNEDSLLLQLKDGFPEDMEVLYVGSLRVDIDPAEQDDVSQYLLEKFKCVPTFLPPDVLANFYDGFCKRQLWPLFHYKLPFSTDKSHRFDRHLWEAYVLANKLFFQKVVEIINPEDDYIWVHDYHLMVLPTFLRRRFNRVKMGFFLHSPFPSSEIYRTLPVREEILKALLNSDIIGFHTFDYARHFLSCCSRMLGLEYQSKRGYLGLEYYGRTISIKIMPVGIHMGRIESVMRMSDEECKARELKQQFEGKTILLGIDDMDIFKGINLKILAMEQMLKQHPKWQGRAVLVQIVNPARGKGIHVDEIHSEIEESCSRIWLPILNILNSKMRIFMTLLLCFAIQMFVFYYMPSATVAHALSSETDKHALLALKEKLTNGVSDSLPSWNESLHFCEWQGITCGRRHMRVSALHLENQNLGGTLGPSLGNLTFLKLLKLSNVNLYGEIPKQVGRLKRLQVLNLSNNNLHGEVPMELSNCTTIKGIFLGINRLTGRIPKWFGSMMQLTQLNLLANNLVGTIPSSMGNVSSLQNISLAENHLKGRIPYSLGMLSSLKMLIIYSNNLSGEIPHSLYNLSNIQVFDIGDNKLFGSLPTHLNLVFPNLIAFLVGASQISGPFPFSISNLTELKMFDISYNSFHGPIPLTLGRLNKLEWFNIGGANFGNGGAHDLDFLSSLTNCTQLATIYLFDNNFGGVLPNLIGNFSTNLRSLHMESNQIYGVIPETIGQLIGLILLQIANNLFEGTIPDSIGKLKNLGVLGLENNKFSGNIPIVIGNLTVLSGLGLYGNILEGSIPFTIRNCTKLQQLSFARNKLCGDIPNNTFGYLEGLIEIDLSNNSLTGPIPSDFGNLQHLSHLYLSLNKLSGEIPKDLASCLAVTELELGRNFFHGAVPLFLGSSLRSLEILDLSENNFSSIIPSELENLTFLNTLNLSFNNLYGEVPMRGVFSNVSAISLTGNKNLCGGIPQLKLPSCFQVPKKHKRSLKKKLIIFSVIGGFVISVIAFIIVHFLTRKSKSLPSPPSLRNEKLRVTYGELHEATNGFSSSNLVGTGSFGSVYKGSLPNFERPIVVKVLNLETLGAAKSFMAECNALGKMKHRNLLKLLTCCSSVDYNGEDFKAIVFEFMPKGSLEKILHDNEGSENHNLNLTQRLDIALDVAHALDYLHNDTEQAVVHCDLKPSNVLLDDDFVAHLGDFGLARLILGTTEHSSKDQVISSTIKGTIGYIPPEYGEGVPVSPQGDIYSFGIHLLEMFTGKRPTNNNFSENLSLHEFCKMNIPEGILEIVDSQLLLPFAEDETGIVENKIRKCLVMFARIGVACSEEFPAHRMLIKDVIVKLLEIKQKLHC